MEVVNHIAAMPKERHPRTVIVHSYNPDRSQEMYRRLLAAGVNAFKIPFNPNTCPVKLG
jgi:hypothetical protein